MKWLLLILSGFSALAAQIPIFSGYDMPARNAEFSSGTYDTYSALRLSGYLMTNGANYDTRWFVPEQVFVSGFTNVMISCNVLTSNGVDVGAHSAAYQFRYLLYTNRLSTNSVSLGSATNTFTPYYDSGNLTAVTVAFRNGTNITYLKQTNTVSSTLFANTNLAFGTVIVTRSDTGSTGSEWLLNARIVITR